MFNKSQILGTVVSLGFLITIPSEVQASETMAKPTMHTSQFHAIAQPLELKVSVTLGGLALIGLELWWFLYRKPQTQQKTHKL